MKPRSMEEKISYLLFLMGFAGLVCTAALCIFVFHKAFREQAWTALEREADLVAAGCAQVDAPSQLETYVDGSLRITLIASDGSVLFESATNQPMENHLSRPEIQQAMKSGVGRDCRDSQTLGYETYYYAMLLTNGDILRVAQDSETIWSIYDAALPAIVLSCFLMMGAAAIIAGLLTKSLVQPVLKMTDDLDHIQENVPYKELIPFAESIHSDRMLRENNEKMRQEFTANVSHELKTPLTSISGYAELIETGIAKPEDTPGFARKIHVEASRMIQLVNDILQLSHLDNVSETGAAPAMETVDLLDVARECVERQKVNARHSYISLTYLGESAPVTGSRVLLDELCQNLCDNAIRYNRPWRKSPDHHGLHPGRSLHPDREGQRHRYPERGADQRVRALLPGGQEPQQSHWRHRSGSGHRQTHRPHPQRPHQAGQRCGRGYHHHRDLRNGFLKFHELHVCPNFRADVFCCKRKMTVTQRLMRTESGDVQPQRPAAADGVRTEGFQFCFGVGGQGIIA